MKRTVVFYRTASGCPIESFLDSFPAETARKITWILSAAGELEGAEKLFFRYCGLGGNIGEYRFAASRVVFRIFCFSCGAELVILGGGILPNSEDIRAEQELKALNYKNDFLLQRGEAHGRLRGLHYEAQGAGRGVFPGL